MALIKSANSSVAARGAVVLDLGDLTRQGQAIIAAAQRQAQAIIADAHAERARLISDAAAAGRADGVIEGRAEGLKQGLAQGQAQALAEHKAALGAMVTGWSGALEQFVGARDRLLSEAKTEVIRLALAIGERVTKRAIEADPAAAAAQLEAVLERVLRPSRLTVRVHPADRAMLADAAPALVQRFAAVQHVELVDDGALARGSCVAVVMGAARDGDAGAGGSGGGATGIGGEIDASIGTQLDRIAEAILPGARRLEARPPPPASGSGAP